MTRLGQNTKWIVRPDRREAVTLMLERALDATRVPVPLPDMFVFEMPGGARVGVEVSASALTDEQARLGAWLELAVADPERTALALEALGVARVEYSSDTAHAYFQAPGGPVFRLAKAS